jgi:beta-1,4-mannosyl-glycoprotein beta-1,4-N-acetylglucosaminyltransferase
VIVESSKTFTGLDKPLILQENWFRFAAFHHKIIHHILTAPAQDPKSTWDVERHQRNALFTYVFPFLQDQKAAQKGDIIVVSDIDEIPRPATILILRNCDVPKRVTFRSHFYYYSFQWQHHGEQWPHGQATIFQGLKPGQTIMPEDLRMESENIRNWWHSTTIWNAGWHCSACFRTTEEMVTKMRSFSHTSLNTEEYRNKARIVDRVRNGLDLWDRAGQTYDRVEQNQDVPEYLKLNKSRWKYLLDRDDENAGFSDV